MKENKKRINILFAAVDIGWRIGLYVPFLSKNLKKKSIIHSFVKFAVSRKQYITKYNYYIPYQKYPQFVQWIFSLFFFLYALIRYDVFYFFSGETILTRKLRRLEFNIYKIFGKKIIMHFVGSDIRDPDYLQWKDKNLSMYIQNKIEAPKKTKDWQDELIKDSRDFSDYILVSTPDLLSIIPQASYYPVVIDTRKFQNELLNYQNSNKHYFKSDKVKVLHAPSNIKLKGSDIINDVIHELAKNDDRFEYIYTKHLNRETNSVYTVSRYELFQLYNEADIVIDQMLIGWYGLQSLEALLAKCSVICYIEEDLKKYLYPECPIISTNSLTLKNDLINTINSVVDNKVDYHKQIKWVEKYHCIENNNEALLKAFK